MMNKSTTPKGRRKAASFVIGAPLILLMVILMVGCGGTSQVKPVKCEDRQIFVPADNHMAAYNAFMGVKIRALMAGVPDDAFPVLGNTDIFRVVER